MNDALKPLVDGPPPARLLDPLGPDDHDEPEFEEYLQLPAHDRLRDAERLTHRFLGELAFLSVEEPPEGRVAGVPLLDALLGRKLPVSKGLRELKGLEPAQRLPDLPGGMVRENLVEGLPIYRRVFVDRF